MLGDGLLLNQTAAAVRAVFAPKAVGMAKISASIAAVPVGALAAFSSVAAFMGSAGQSSYAAANAALDAQLESTQAAGHSGKFYSKKMTHLVC